MTIDKAETTRLFRRPRRSTMERVSLAEAREAETYPEPDSDEYDTDSDEENLKESNQHQSDIKLPPLSVAQNYVRDQLISIVEENTINDSTVGSYDNFRFFGSNPNSPASPEIRLYKSPANRPSVAKSYRTEYLSHSSPPMRRSIVKPYKPLGPDPLPARPPKLNQDDVRARRDYYQSLTTQTDSSSENNENYFDLNDFLLDSAYNQRLVASCVRSISKYNYRQMCRLLEDKIQEERNRNSSNVKINLFNSPKHS